MNNLSRKIAVLGDPHSGKSVFLGALCNNLPRDKYYLFRACPDGEGTWTWKNSEASKYRVKGSFNSTLVEWYKSSLRRTLAPLTLVDLGGRRSTENEQLVSACTDCIILSNSLEGIKEWEKFASRLNRPVIAKVYSNFTATEDTCDLGIFTCHHLDRDDKTVDSRSTISSIAMMLLNLLGDEKSPQKEKTMITILNVAELATSLGKTEVKKTLPNGREISTIEWSGKDLKGVSTLLHNMPKEGHVKINGAMPGFLAVALTHECHPSWVSINSPDGYIGIGCKKPQGSGSSEVLNFSSTPLEGGVVRIDISQKDVSIPLKPECLDTLVPPEVAIDSTVVLSGRMPLWIMASLAMAYHGHCKAVGLFQPGVGATICITHSTDVELGSVIEMK